METLSAIFLILLSPIIFAKAIGSCFKNIKTYPVSNYRGAPQQVAYYNKKHKDDDKKPLPPIH
jgi:hypothetical protein